MEEYTVEIERRIVERAFIRVAASSPQEAMDIASARIELSDDAASWEYSHGTDPVIISVCDESGDDVMPFDGQPEKATGDTWLSDVREALRVHAGVIVT